MSSYNFKDTNFIVKSAFIAAIYAVITYLFLSLSYGPLQFRISEILVLLIFYNKKFLPGLLVGCAIANLGSPLGLPDVILGTFASFLAFLFIPKAKNLFIASLFPVLSMIIPAITTYMLTENTISFSLMTFYFMLSEFIVVSIIGVIVFKLLEKNSSFMKFIRDF